MTGISFIRLQARLYSCEATAGPVDGAQHMVTSGSQLSSGILEHDM